MWPSEREQHVMQASVRCAVRQCDSLRFLLSGVILCQCVGALSTLMGQLSSAIGDGLAPLFGSARSAAVTSREITRRNPVQLVYQETDKLRRAVSSYLTIFRAGSLQAA